jgi:hypothetical protein
MVAKNDRGAVRRDGRGGTVVTAGIESDTTGAADSGREAQQVLARKLRYLIGQITPEEFRRQDANYGRDSALGRELLFLIANNEWARATSEVIDIARSDTVDTTIKIDVDLSRIVHEAFRDRTGQLWLPVLVLPPLQSRNLEPDPFATCTVTDASGAQLATLPNADVRHRVAAALAEIIVNIAVARLPDLGQPGASASRDERLLLAAAIYRLLRSENVPKSVLKDDAVAQQPPKGPAQRIGTARSTLTDLLGLYADLLGPALAEPAQAAAAGPPLRARPRPLGAAGLRARAGRAGDPGSGGIHPVRDCGGGRRPGTYPDRADRGGAQPPAEPAVVAIVLSGAHTGTAPLAGADGSEPGPAPSPAGDRLATAVGRR